MATHKILAEETISVTEFRKNPSHYFTDHPVAVLSHNQPKGYLLSPELFESMMDNLEQSQAGRNIVGQFRPSAARMQEIVAKGAELVASASEEKLGSFSE